MYKKRGLLMNPGAMPEKAAFFAATNDIIEPYKPPNDDSYRTLYEKEVGRWYIGIQPLI